MTRTQFALDALVAAGHVSQAKVDAALALFPAPAGEPEMPVLDKALLDLIGNYGFENRNGRNEVEVTHHYCQLIAGIKVYARAYGAARAEHARRVAMEEAALIVDAEEDDAREERYHPGLVGALSACAAAIRAAAPPQGEQK